MKHIVVIIGLLFFIISPYTETHALVFDSQNNFVMTVYPNQGWYTAKDFQGNIINNNIPDVVIKTALDKGGEIYIAGGVYQLSKNFAGFNLKSGTHLKLASDAKIVVPSGYEGYVFRFVGVTHDCIIDGGTISEAEPVKRDWTGIIMQAGSIYFNLVENMVITDPYIIINLNGTEGHYINANTFVNIQGFTFVKGIQFVFNGNPIHGNGIYGNTFRDLQFESGPMTTYGIKDIRHDNNAFYNVQIWDLPLGSHSSTIHSSAKNTLIVGGQMTHYGFVDDGKKTIIFDAWHNTLPVNSTLFSTMLDVLLGQVPSKNDTAIGTVPLSASNSINSTNSTQFKNDVKSWSQSKISDETFVTSIQNLVKMGIIEKPNETQTMKYNLEHIPTWFKKDAGWWTDGQISASDFISTLQYLIDSGMIRLT